MVMPNRTILRKYKPIAYIIVGIVLLVLISVYLYVSSRAGDRFENQAIYSDVSRYEHSLVGDNNAVAGIISALPEGKHIDKIELKTETKPYGISLHGTAELTGPEIETISAQLLKLVDNCDWVEITSSQFHAKTTRDGLKEFSVIN